MGRMNYTTEQIVIKLREVGGSVWARKDYSRSCTSDWRNCANVLPLAKAIWRYEHIGCKAA